jgi:hypothetical protein
VEDSTHAVRDPVERRNHAGAPGRDSDGVVGLVGEERHDDEGDPGLERAERRAGAAVTHRDRSVREHVRLRNPALDVDIRRHGVELELVASGQEDATGQAGRRLQGLPVRDGRGRERRGNAAEADVDQRPLVAGPPIG